MYPESIFEKCDIENDSIVRLAIGFSLAGILFAFCAVGYVWLARGQFAFVTFFAAVWALDITFRYYLFRRRKQRRPEDELFSLDS